MDSVEVEPPPAAAENPWAQVRAHRFTSLPLSQASRRLTFHMNLPHGARIACRPYADVPGGCYVRHACDRVACTDGQE